jgi:hypothetical protein
MPHSMEPDWFASTAAGANNVCLTLWIDGTQKASITGMDNDIRQIESVRLGAASGEQSTSMHLSLAGKPISGGNDCGSNYYS